jgi:serine/threonine protein kinase
VQVLFGKELSGNVLLNQFLITNKLGQGAFGDVYEVRDITQLEQVIPLVLKVSKDFKIMAREIQAMKAFRRRHEAESLQSGSFNNMAEYMRSLVVPQVLSYGMFTQMFP